MQQNTLLESYLRQLKLPTFAQNYAAIASDAARTGLSCERYLLALCEAELAQRDANRVERCIAQAKLPVLKELSQFDWSCVQGVSKTRVFELAEARLHRARRAHSHDREPGPWKNTRGRRIGPGRLPPREAGALLQCGHLGQ
jgi:DNA replication protein DnaC